MKNNKTFLILGASSDLGKCLIKRLDGEYSDSLFVMHFNSSDEELKAIELHNGNTARLVKADFTSDEDVDSLIQMLKDENIEPTHIVHLPAAKLLYTRLKDFDEDRLLKNVKIQVTSFIEILKAFLPGMAKKKDHCKVVAVLSSVVNGQPPKSMLEYVAVKSMLLGVIRQLAADYTGKMVGINAVSPSMIDTKLLSDIDPKIIQLSAESSSEKRNATVEEIVPVISFLLSDDSNYLNGANINVTNGNVIL